MASRLASHPLYSHPLAQLSMNAILYHTSTSVVEGICQIPLKPRSESCTNVLLSSRNDFMYLRASWASSYGAPTS